VAVIVVGLPGIDERRCKRDDSTTRLPRRFEPGGSGLYSRPVATLLETKLDFSAAPSNDGQARQGGEALQCQAFRRSGNCRKIACHA
jgi:hypothetical protein